MVHRYSCRGERGGGGIKWEGLWMKGPVAQSRCHYREDLQ